MNIVWKDPESESEIQKQGSFYISDSGIKHRIVNQIPRFVDKKNYTSGFGIQYLLVSLNFCSFGCNFNRVC